jgi:hypothetical protein
MPLSHASSLRRTERRRGAVRCGAVRCGAVFAAPPDLPSAFPLIPLAAVAAAARSEPASSAVDLLFCSRCCFVCGAGFLRCRGRFVCLLPGFQVYVDGARFLPDNVTISKATVRLVAADGLPPGASARTQSRCRFGAGVSPGTQSRRRCGAGVSPVLAAHAKARLLVVPRRFAHRGPKRDRA